MISRIFREVSRTAKAYYRMQLDEAILNNIQNEFGLLPLHSQSFSCLQFRTYTRNDSHKPQCFSADYLQIVSGKKINVRWHIMNSSPDNHYFFLIWCYA